MKRLSQIIKVFFGLPISALALFFIISIVFKNAHVISTQIKTIDIFLLSCGIVFLLIYFIARALLWQKILEYKGYRFPFKETAFIWAFAELKRYVPGNIWSMVTKFMLFSEKKVGKKHIFVSLIEEAQCVLLGSAIVSIFCLSFVFYHLFPYQNYAQILLFISYGIIAIFLVLYILRNPKKYAMLLAISVFSFFFFGLGTYLTILSISTLSPLYLLTFISFFTFCYFIGYLSFVTPMGLGIREGMMALGLSRFMPTAIAGFAGIYARIGLIFSELIFLGVIFLWYKSKHASITHLETFAKKYRYELLLGISILVYITYFTTASFLRYDNFFTGRFDLGNMDQTVWNTFRGRMFQLTDPNGTMSISRLAIHADFILIFLAPLYKIWADPRMLLLLQTVTLAFGSLFIFLIGNNVVKNKNLSLLFAVLFLLNPAIQYSNLYDFHPVVLATTFLLGAYYFLMKKKYGIFLLFLILSGLTKENIWIIVSLFGLLVSVHERKNIKMLSFGLIIFTVSLGIFYYLVWYAIPQARGGQHFALSYYSDFGDTPTSIAKNIIFNPQKAMTTMFHEDRIFYIYQLFLPVGFLSFFSPIFLLFAAPDLAISLLSSNPQLRQIYYQYTAAVTPFIFISAIFGAKRIISFSPKYSYLVTCYLLLVTCYSAYIYGPLPGAKNPNIAMFTQPPKNKVFINTYLSGIQKHYSVAATNNLGSHLSERLLVYTIPLGMDHADIIVFLFNDPFARPSLEVQKQMAESLKKDPRYTVSLEIDDFVAFQKK